ncbi:MAG TPA: hypothetical protein VKA84_16925, partial [Gemmatimonadaceae bacterium]|nr:hypothetical protein [Gemmatimonadaceae bacterium]
RTGAHEPPAQPRVGARIAARIAARVAATRELERLGVQRHRRGCAIGAAAARAQEVARVTAQQRVPDDHRRDRDAQHEEQHFSHVIRRAFAAAVRLLRRPRGLYSFRAFVTGL